uniref:Uncharacterized protein n=1 Tax=Salix viminalis TaxID=40686 RepID=A0A6N2N8J6_SALVM
MAGERKRILVGLVVAMILGIAVYFRLWTIDYAISSDDAELIRRQFDLANREAMDESAEWRMKYDEEVERSAKCDKQLIEIKQKVEDAASINQQLVMLQKENMAPGWKDGSHKKRAGGFKVKVSVKNRQGPEVQEKGRHHGKTADISHSSSSLKSNTVVHRAFIKIIVNEDCDASRCTSSSKRKCGYDLHLKETHFHGVSGRWM